MLYTFMLSHKNTICVRQAAGNSVKEALDLWVPMLEGVSFGKEENRATLNLEEVLTELKEARPVPLKDLDNAWCIFLKFNGTNALINVVATQQSEIDENDKDVYHLA